MPLLIYTTEYRNQLSSKQLQVLFDKLPPALQEKALRYRRWQDAYGCIFGKCLLSIALEKIGFSGDLSIIEYSLENKPFIRVGPHFNISHSGNRVVCIVCAETRVGIDIEYSVDEVMFDEFQSQFTRSEWRVIRSASDPKEEFYRMWTAKESVIKADGRGLAIPLKKIDVSRYQPVLLDGKVWVLTRLFQFDDYVCHFCLEYLAAEDGPLPTKNSLARVIDIDFHEVLPTDFLVEGFCLGSGKRVGI
jgi:4'-phosphopantetheinyl transferase